MDALATALQDQIVAALPVIAGVFGAIFSLVLVVFLGHFIVERVQGGISGRAVGSGARDMNNRGMEGHNRRAGAGGSMNGGKWIASKPHGDY